MKTNFEIEENYAVRLNGRHIDLHNNFDLAGIIENENEIQIEFVKSKGDWIQKDEFESLTFINKIISFKYFEEGEKTEFPEDENTISTITFFPSSMRDIHDRFSENSKPNKNDDIIFYFENGKVIRINCEEIEMKTKR